PHPVHVPGKELYPKGAFQVVNPAPEHVDGRSQMLCGCPETPLPNHLQGDVDGLPIRELTHSLKGLFTVKNTPFSRQLHIFVMGVHMVFLTLRKKRWGHDRVTDFVAKRRW